MYRRFLRKVEYSIRSIEEQSYGQKQFRKVFKLTEVWKTKQSTSIEPDMIQESKRVDKEPDMSQESERVDKEPENARVLSESARKSEELEKLYKNWLTAHVSVIHAAFQHLLLASVVLRLCEIVMSPSIQSKCVDVALILWLLDMSMITGQVFHWRLLILAILTVKSSVLSEGLTGLFKDWIWVETLCDPLVDYFQDDISDRGEIRLFLIGILLSGFFHVTSAFMSIFCSFSKILIVALGATIGVHVGTIMVFHQGPWIWLCHRPGEEPGTVLKRPIIQTLQQDVLYMVRLFVFSLNRLGKWLARHFWQLTEVPNTAPERPDSQYEYEPLKPNQIRLLRVFAGNSSHSIECRLEIVDLGKLSFEAISYVWGDGGFNRFVSIEGKRLGVTESAYSVIKRRRSKWRERLLWIDQVCINQDDLAERASQVRLMGTLYKSADRVVAWLGPSTSAYLVQSFLAELQYKKEGWGYRDEKLQDSCAHVTGRHWNALSEFLQNDWFTRVWIVQEAAFSKELHLLYGDVCMDWDSVGKGLAVLWQRQMLNNVPSLGGSFFSDARQRVYIGLCNADTMLEFWGDVDYGKVFNLSTALENCLGFQCSNKRDRIYALGNLVEDTTIIPDYGMEIPTLYVQTMKHILLHANSLDAMNFAGTGYGPGVVGDLPTWVSDWDQDGKPPKCPKHYTSYSAGSAHDPVVFFDEKDSSVVYLQGWERDRVAHLTESLEISASTNMVENNHIQWSWYAEAEYMAMQHAIRYQEETLLESFVRTLLGNRISNLGGRPSRAECLDKYELLQQYFCLFEVADALARLHEIQAQSDAEFRRLRAWTCLLGGLIDPVMYSLIQQELRSSEVTEKSCYPKAEQEDIYQQYNQAWPVAGEFEFYSSALGNRFCVTEQGRMAIVPPRCRKNDIIGVMKGARMPFILRKRKDMSRETYELVGCCYVHGIMDCGQARTPGRKYAII